MNRIEVKGAAPRYTVLIDGQPVACSSLDLHFEARSLPDAVIGLPMLDGGIEIEGTVTLGDEHRAILERLGWLPPGHECTQVPKRFCSCQGCPACGEHPGSHGALYDADSTRTLKCPGCQAAATARRNARPSSSSRGYDGEYQRNKPVIIEQGRRGRPCYICHREFGELELITVEHIVKLKDGGTSELSNLAPAHSRCNTAWNRGQRG